MTTTTYSTATTHPVKDWTRKYAFAGGAFYILTFLSSIPALILIQPVLDNADYIVSAGSDNRVLWGCLLDVVNAFTAVASAVAVFHVVKRRNEGLALGFVTSRVIEAATIMIGVVSLLAVVTLRQDFVGVSGEESAVLVNIGQSLVAVRDWTFLLGPGLMAVFNALLFGTLLYKSGLVPRIIPIVGLMGAPLLFLATITTFFGHNEQVSTFSAVATLPIAAWELSVGIYMLVKGFKPDAVAALPEAR
jgi:hypothetical protein